MRTTLTAVAAAAALALSLGAAPAADAARDLTARVHRVCTDDGNTRVVMTAHNPTSQTRYVTFDWRFTDTGVTTVSTWINPRRDRKKAFILAPDRAAHVTIARGEGLGDPIIERKVRPLDC